VHKFQVVPTRTNASTLSQALAVQTASVRVSFARPASFVVIRKRFVFNRRELLVSMMHSVSICVQVATVQIRRLHRTIWLCRNVRRAANATLAAVVRMGIVAGGIASH
jgi:hypothetical protein